MGEVTEKDMLLLDGSQPCVVVGNDAQGAYLTIMQTVPFIQDVIQAFFSCR